APGDDRSAGFEDAEDRARAWAGGELVVGTRGDDTAVVLHLAEHDDAPVPLCTTVTQWYGRAFPDATRDAGEETTFTGADQAATVTCDDGQVRLALGPDLEAVGQAADG